MQVGWTGDALPFPMDLSDEPVRGYLGNYGSVPLEAESRPPRGVPAIVVKGMLKAENVARPLTDGPIHPGGPTPCGRRQTCTGRT
jgi:hypothetical protein